MCDLCGMRHCPPGCPEYDGQAGELGDAVGRCALCDGVIRSGQRVLHRQGKMLCEDCMRDAEPQELLELLGIDDMTELLCEHLGWRMWTC